MEPTQQIDQAMQLKAVADPHRIEILRLIMSGPATLSQLGAALGRHPAWIRHHVKQLEAAGLIALTESRKVGGHVEKYYAATAQAFAVRLTIFPQPGERGAVLVLGSDDLALELLADTLHGDTHAPDVFRLPMGSLEGLIALRQGLGHVAGCHLLDPETGDYNVPYARHLFPGLAFTVVTLAHRRQGLLLAHGNPLAIDSVSDAVAAGARFVNRNAGSGTRIWLDRQLESQGIARGTVAGYGDEVFTHREAAQAVADGRADVAVAIKAVAAPLGLAFVPLFEERFDLVMLTENRHTPLLEPLFERLSDTGFKRAVDALDGYSAAHCGEEVTVAA